MKFKQKLFKRFLFIIFWLILIISFCFFAILIILKANGYEINLKSRKIIKTGMIILDGDPKNAAIYLNQEKLLMNLPGRITHLTPGNYEITISLAGYNSWQKSITVYSGKASVYQNITLFLETSENISDLKINLEDFKNEALNNSGSINLLGAEIYFNGKLITRFTKNITAAFIYPDKQHLVLQIEDKILIIDLDGSNIQSLLKLWINIWRKQEKKPKIIIFITLIVRDAPKNLGITI